MKNEKIAWVIAGIVIFIFLFRPFPFGKEINLEQDFKKQASGALQEGNSFTKSSSAVIMYGVTCKGQTFTPSNTFDLSAVKLKLRQWQASGPFEIKVTDPSFKTIYSTGAINANTILTTDSIVEIPMGSATLNSGATYDFYACYPSGISGNYTAIHIGTPDSYAGGEAYHTIDGGSSWFLTGSGAYDVLFEVWGTTITPTQGPVCPANICSDNTITWQEFIDTGNYWVNS